MPCGVGEIGASPLPVSVRLPDCGAEMEMTESTSAPILVRAELLVVLDGLAALADLEREPVIPPPPWRRIGLEKAKRRLEIVLELG